MDYLVRGLARNGKVGFFIANTKEIVNQAYEFHRTTPTASAALGRLLTAGAIMGRMLKNDAKITIRINGGGSLGTLMVDANSNGEVRGFVSNPEATLPLKENGKLDVGGAVGTNGFISVIKDLGIKENFSSQSQLQTGEIGDDLSYYFLVSEQIPSIVGLGVLVDVDYSIKASGGFIIQLHPGHDEDDVKYLEDLASKYTSVTDLMDKYKPEEIAKLMFGDDVTFTKQDLKFHCPCSKERFIHALSTIATSDIKEMIEEDHGCDIVCQFCSKEYHLDESDLYKSLELRNNK
ncbi:TPA: Hsp33 family molecular chaperone HslO [bacterium]|nr:Hsp33 family molecular chaperone HslO [bacterium]